MAEIVIYYHSKSYICCWTTIVVEITKYAHRPPETTTNELVYNPGQKCLAQRHKWLPSNRTKAERGDTAHTTSPGDTGWARRTKKWPETRNIEEVLKRVVPIFWARIFVGLSNIQFVFFLTLFILLDTVSRRLPKVSTGTLNGTLQMTACFLWEYTNMAWAAGRRLRLILNCHYPRYKYNWLIQGIWLKRDKKRKAYSLTVSCRLRHFQGVRNVF